MDRGQLPTNQLHDINWGALDHASHAPQLVSCNYSNCVCVCVCVCVCARARVVRSDPIMVCGMNSCYKDLMHFAHSLPVRGPALSGTQASSPVQVVLINKIIVCTA